MAATDFKDYYETLGIDKSATEKEIKRAYRKLARKHHPDLNQDDPGAEDRFKEVNEAHEVLSDPEKRKQYDQYGQYWQQASQRAGQQASRPGAQYSQYAGQSDGFVDGFGGGSGGGFESADFGQYGDFNEFIEELLGGRRRRQSGYGNIPAQDTEAAIALTFSEAFHGTTKHLGIGDENITVRIPAGAKPGSRIRLKGKGQPSPFTHERGNLYLTVDLISHPYFKLEKGNVVCEVPISPWEAALGGPIEVPTPDGSVNMTVPAGSNSGQTLRLRGKGWKNPEGDRTDELVRLKIVSPQAISDQERTYWEKLQQSSSFEPRQSLEGITL